LTPRVFWRKITIVLKVLRDIGARLMRETRPLAGKPRVEMKEVPRGAAGDRAYPIDRKSEEIIIAGLEATGEPLTVISEEAGVVELAGGGRTVLVDPIDGSRNAISGIPFYCTSIAVASGQRIKDISLAYVINLATGDEFWAERGKGAFLNAGSISAQKDGVLYLVAYEAQNPGKDIPAILPLLSRSRKTRCLGATALGLAYLAAGAVSVFVTPAPSRSFDFAGGWLLVKEAGGVITDPHGNPLDEVKLGLERASPLMASGNEGLHQEALRLIMGKGR
jgi:myo-inositol-1(or 4)-monophosphatase